MRTTPTSRTSSTSPSRGRRGAAWRILLLCGSLIWPVAALGGAFTAEQARERGEVTAETAGTSAPEGKINVFVYVDPTADRDPIRAFAQQQGGFVRYEYKAALPNVMNLRHIPEEAVNALRQIAGVADVVEDRYHPNLIKLDESTPRIRALQSQLSGAGFTEDGSGVRVCVCDTGIDMDHIMYSSRIDTAASFDFVNNDNNPDDDHGHGAHVAGIAVGGTGLTVNFEPPVCDGDEPFQGVAPGATLIGAKILNQNGGGNDSDIVAGIDHCADQTAGGGQADVINLSIGTGQFSGTCDSHVWAVAANNAVANGVVVVAAAGNEGYTNALATPACGSDVIAVGATYKADYPRCEDSQTGFTWCLDFFCFSTCTDNSPPADDHVCFSNRSVNLDVTAPGSVIWSAGTSAGGSSITEQSGTSMASPHVAGLAALILNADPGQTPAQVRQIIRDGAVDLGAAGFDTTYGFGRVDAINSLGLVQPEVCGNGNCGAGEDQCNCATDCGTPPGTETNCTDGVDNDCDTLVDCDDTADCSADPACICNNNGTCESGEDCNNCSGDCISGGGGCGNGICEPILGEDCLSCPGDCRGKQNGNPSRRYCCGDGDGEGPVGCSDPRCTSEGWACSNDEVPGYCCGDGSCDGAEDTSNCSIDCDNSCSVPTDCDDMNECTVDDCIGGVCDNSAVADDTPCSGGLCCSGSCSAPACSTNPDCDDADACTTDICLNPGTCAASCDNSAPPCGSADGCCGPGCTPGNDPDCACGGPGAACSSNGECCSNKCKGNGTCK